MFLGIDANVYETLKSKYEDKHEYILPELTLNKNLYSDENLGNFELVSNLKVHNYDTNKSSTFLLMILIGPQKVFSQLTLLRVYLKQI